MLFAATCGVVYIVGLLVVGLAIWRMGEKDAPDVRYGIAGVVVSAVASLVLGVGFPRPLAENAAGYSPVTGKVMSYQFKHPPIFYGDYVNVNTDNPVKNTVRIAQDKRPLPPIGTDFTYYCNATTCVAPYSEIEPLWLSVVLPIEILLLVVGTREVIYARRKKAKLIQV